MSSNRNVALDAHVLLDTEGLRARLSESVCEEYIIDTLPANATDDAVGLRIDRICEIASNEPDRVAKMLKEELGNIDGSGELAGLIADAIDVVAVRLLHDYNKKGLLDVTPVSVPASCTLQVWKNDYAITMDTAEFECQAALDQIPLDELPEYADDFKSEGACNYGDDVWFAAVAAGLVEDWDGPFEFYITDDEAYEKYLEMRKSTESRSENN